MQDQTENNLTDAEIAKLEACKSERDWTAACDEIKAARKGQYPADWWPKVQRSGLMYRVTQGFAKG